MFIFSTSVFSQVGINTTNPNATLDVVSSLPNSLVPDGIIPPKLTGLNLKNKDELYSTEQTGSIVYITEALVESDTSAKTRNVTEIGYFYFDGIIWQKLNTNGGLNSTVTNGLTKSGDSIKLGGTLNEVTTINTSASNVLKLNGLQDGVASNGKILMIDNDNTIKASTNITNELSIPSPAIFNLANDISNFLSAQTVGLKTNVSMTLIKNSITGLSYVPNSSMITFPKGIYQITFVYEATHNASSCTISSYIVDFPKNVGSERVHSTASHNQGALSNHGGTVTYTTILSNDNVNWPIQLGRGQSGNCLGNGMTLEANSTQLVIFRIGDI